MSILWRVPSCGNCCKVREDRTEELCQCVAAGDRIVLVPPVLICAPATVPVGVQ